MNYQKSVIDLIKTRKSSRTYDNRAIESSKLKNLSEYLVLLNSEAKIKARFAVVNSEDLGSNSGKKLGTYGVITGASTYVVGILDKEEKNSPAFGYLFEKIILKATDLELQTCWLGGTFKKSDFEKAISLKENEQIVMVSPVGYQKQKKRLLEKAMRKFAGSDNRKPWNELFFNESITTPLNEDKAGKFVIPLEMVRLAPSASNKQPWRIIQEKGSYHFFLCRTKGYWVTAFDMQKSDIGIAWCHFELSARELGLTGTWQQKTDTKHPNEWEYIASWT
jgi:hypothetical protein